jgi:hypothetical protein
VAELEAAITQREIAGDRHAPAKADGNRRLTLDGMSELILKAAKPSFRVWLLS